MRFGSVALATLLSALALVAIAYASVTSTVLHVYRDGVSLSITYSDTYTEGTRGNLTATLDIAERSFSGRAELRLVPTTSSSASQPTIEFNISSSNMPSGNTATSRTTLYLNVQDNAGKLTINSRDITAYADLTSKKGSIRGSVEVEAVGEGKAVLQYLSSTLNKDAVENALKQYNITGVRINKLDTVVSSGKASIVFDVDIDYIELNKSITRLYATAPAPAPTIPITSWSKMNVPSNMRVNGRVSAEGVVATAEVSVKADINEYLDTLLQYMKLTTGYWVGSIGFGSTQPTTQQLGADYLSKVADVVGRFKLLPSRMTLSVVTDPALKTLTVKVETPKFVKKGGTVTDTLIELHNAWRELASAVKKEELLNTTVAVEAEPGVKVMKNGTPTSQVRVADLPNLTVVVEHATPTAIPTEAAVGATVAAVAIIAVLAIAKTRK